MNNDIRWKQRFQNFENSYAFFQRRFDAYKKDPDDEAYQASLVKSFELLFALSWKTLKDYLECMGKNPKTARITLQEAFQEKLVKDGEKWINALDRRNDATHVYDEKIMIKVLSFIEQDFYPMVRELYFDLKKEL